jgi:hypothetical protein
VKEALEKFRALPESERAPGAVDVGDHGPVDESADAPAPPAGAIVVRVFGRMLARDGKADDGPLRHARAGDFPLIMAAPQDERDLYDWAFESHPDYLWIKREEGRAMAPPDGAKEGDEVEVPASLARRICRMHLIPQRTYGEGGEWGRDQLRHADMRLVVTRATPDGVEMRLTGSAHMGSAFDAAKATTPNGPLERGYAPAFDGALYWDRAAGAFTRFDVVALGDAWGRMGDANNHSHRLERPGRWPLGFAFELADPQSVPADRLTPTGRAERVRSGWYWEEQR